MSTAQREPRREQRSGFDPPTRISLLEGDADASDARMEALSREIRGEVKAIKNMLLAVLASAATATVVGAINLFYQRLAG